jgi:hypothetical protein
LKNELDREFSTYDGEVHTEFWWGNLRERDNLEDPDIDGRIILRWIFRKREGGGHGLESSGSRFEQVSGNSKHGIELKPRQ